MILKPSAKFGHDNQSKALLVLLGTITQDDVTAFDKVLANHLKSFFKVYFKMNTLQNLNSTNSKNIKGSNTQLAVNYTRASFSLEP